jgi:hypothetical protein
MPLDGQHRRITLAEDPGSARPERHFPSGAAQTRTVSVIRALQRCRSQTRTVSVAIFRLDPRKSVRSFKGIICGDISEFESYHPSHAVWSPRANMRMPLKRAAAWYFAGVATRLNFAGAAPAFAARPSPRRRSRSQRLRARGLARRVRAAWHAPRDRAKAFRGAHRRVKRSRSGEALP